MEENILIQRDHAEALYLNYDYQPYILEGVNGWEQNSPDLWERVIFLSEHGCRSSRHIFYVVFVPGTADVKEYGVR